MTVNIFCKVVGISRIVFIANACMLGIFLDFTTPIKPLVRSGELAAILTRIYQQKNEVSHA